jgi:hypothetical protein
MSTKSRIIRLLDRRELDSRIDWGLKHTKRKDWFTYIARSTIDPDVYKFGRSLDPVKREKTFRGKYRDFRFKMLYFLNGDIEYCLLYAILISGADSPLLDNPNHKVLEAFFLNEKDIKHIVEKCGFKPITELQ